MAKNDNIKDIKAMMARITNAYYEHLADMDKPLNNEQSKKTENDKLDQLPELDPKTKQAEIKRQQTINEWQDQFKNDWKELAKNTPSTDEYKKSTAKKQPINQYLPTIANAFNIVQPSPKPTKLHQFNGLEDVQDEGPLLPGELNDYPSEEDMQAYEQAMADEADENTTDDTDNHAIDILQASDVMDMEKQLQTHPNEESALSKRTKMFEPDRLSFDQRFTLEIDHVHTHISKRPQKQQIRYRVIAKQSQQEMNNLTIEQVHQLIWLLQK